MITVSKIGKIKAIIHRPVEGTVKTLTIRKTPTGKWYAAFSVEKESTETPHEHPSEEITGIDLGLRSFATFSSGERIENPRFFHTEEKELARVQWNRDAIPKCSKSRVTANRVVARVHERIANKRKNFIHQISRKLVDRFKLIVFEDLTIKNMQQSHHLAKSIADASWGMMVQATQNKAADAGSQVVLVNPYNTSQSCSRCGKIVAKDLTVRIHSCPFCGLTMDRDQNAAINILRLGLQSLPGGPAGLEAPTLPGSGHH